MKLLSKLSKIPFVFFILIVFIASCNKDKTEAPVQQHPDDIVIQIDENSVFNQRNFKLSFEQIMGIYNLWAFDWTHNHNAQKKLQSSELNYTIFGKFGNNIESYQHEYDENGVIVRTSLKHDYLELTTYYTYDYDNKGFVSQMFVHRNDQLVNEFHIKYDDQLRIIERYQPEIEDLQNEDIVEIGYYDDSKQRSYKDNSNDITFFYTNDLVTEIQNKDSYGGLEKMKIEYADHEKIKKVINEEEIETYEYTDLYLIIKHHDESIHESSTYYEKGLKETKYLTYSYDADDNFRYCVERRRDENGNFSEYNYYGGSYDHLVFEGKSLITQYHEQTYRPAEQRFYDVSNTELYINSCDYKQITYNDHSFWEVVNYKWFLTDGTEIQLVDINESWVLRLSAIIVNKSNVENKPIGIPLLK